METGLCGDSIAHQVSRMCEDCGIRDGHPARDSQTAGGAHPIHRHDTRPGLAGSTQEKSG